MSRKRRNPDDSPDPAFWAARRTAPGPPFTPFTPLHLDKGVGATYLKESAAVSLHAARRAPPAPSQGSSPNPRKARPHDDAGLFPIEIDPPPRLRPRPDARAGPRPRRRPSSATAAGSHLAAAGSNVGRGRPSRRARVRPRGGGAGGSGIGGRKPRARSLDWLRPPGRCSRPLGGCRGSGPLGGLEPGAADPAPPRRGGSPARPPRRHGGPRLGARDLPRPPRLRRKDRSLRTVATLGRPERPGLLPRRSDGVVRKRRGWRPCRRHARSCAGHRGRR